jgi:KUP system potassium uptake protein
VPGTAVFLHPTKETAPLALRANVEFNRVLHDRVVIVSVLSERVPHVPVEHRLTVDDLGDADDGIVHLSACFGFHDEQDIPDVVRQACILHPELDYDPGTASYFLSYITIEPCRTRA